MEVLDDGAVAVRAEPVPPETQGRRKAQAGGPIALVQNGGIVDDRRGQEH